MHLWLRSGPREVEIVERDQVLEFHALSDAFEFLKEFLVDPANRPMLREALSQTHYYGDLSRFEDHDLLLSLAQRLVSGELRVISRRHTQRIKPKDEAPEATPREVEAAAATPPAEPAEAPPPAQPPPSDPILENVDTVAQAATLQAAAQTGTPVCEA